MSDKKPKDTVRKFYDSYGWKREGESGRFMDEVAHEDQNEIVRRYMFENENRYLQYFEQGGQYFLDAGCGAEPRRHFSSKFKFHVCTDFSETGLIEARKLLGEDGQYVQADLAALPFKSGIFGGVLASHVLYHVDKDDQPKVVQEFQRILQPTRYAIVFYASKYNLVSVFQKLRKIVTNLSKKLFSRSSTSSPPVNPTDRPRLYYQPIPLKTLLQGLPKTDVTCLRTLTKAETTLLAKLHLLKIVVPILMFCEHHFPHFMRRIGVYLTIRIEKIE